MSVLIIAEHDNQDLSPNTAHLVTAAKQLSGDVTVWLLGADLSSTAQQASMLEGVSQVWASSAVQLEHPIAEVFAPVIADKAGDFQHILMPASTFGKNILPRVGAILDLAPISEIIEILDDKTFKRPIYAGNAIATVQSADSIIPMTVRTTAFDATKTSDCASAITEVPVSVPETTVKFGKLEASKSERPELTNARVVVSGGRGLQSKENFVMLEQLADKLGAAVGASRAAVDAGFVPNDYQVGQTGKVVAPELYIAIGISGAIQHIAGMKDSKVIVAINKDPDAPIFQIADYGLAGDLFKIVPELLETL